MLVIKVSGKAGKVWNDIRNLSRLSPNLTIGDIAKNKRKE